MYRRCLMHFPVYISSISERCLIISFSTALVYTQTITILMFYNLKKNYYFFNFLLSCIAFCLYGPEGSLNSTCSNKSFVLSNCPIFKQASARYHWTLLFQYIFGLSSIALSKALIAA